MTLQWRRKWRGGPLVADVDGGRYLVSRYFGRGNAWEAQWNGQPLNTFATQSLAKQFCEDQHNGEPSRCQNRRL